MSSTLARTGYVLPVGTENCDVNIVNANMTKVDAQIGALVCTSSTRPSTPYSGQIVFETDTQMFAFYTGSVWIQFVGPTNGTVVHEAEYNQTGVQSIPNATDTPLGFDSAITTSADVTRGTATGGGIANGKFTLNRAGLWAIDAGLRMQTASTFSAGIWIGLDNSGAFRLGGSMQNSGGAANIETTVSFTRRFGAATPLNVYCWQNSGSAKNTDPFAGCTHFRAAWLRP
jgi:hypothetical protein